MLRFADSSVRHLKLSRFRQAGASANSDLGLNCSLISNRSFQETSVNKYPYVSFAYKRRRVLFHTRNNNAKVGFIEQESAVDDWLASEILNRASRGRSPVVMLWLWWSALGQGYGGVLLGKNMVECSWARIWWSALGLGYGGVLLG